MWQSSPIFTNKKYNFSEGHIRNIPTTHAALKKKISEISAKQKHCLGGLNTHVIYKSLIMQNINQIIHQ